MRTSVLLAAIAAGCVVGAAHAGISMSFADPVPGRQWHNQADGAGPGIGLMTYDTTAPITFLFDGTEESLGSHAFVNARMELSMSIGPAVTIGGVTTAPVEGYFRIFDVSGMTPVDILQGIASAGTFVRISNTNSILFSDPNFHYIVGPALSALVGPVTLIDPSEAVFTLTSVVAAGGGHFINPDGTFRTFDANASFSGNAEVPAPGAIALAAIGGLLIARRRRD
jgi:hypothetical protein